MLEDARCVVLEYGNFLARSLIYTRPLWRIASEYAQPTMKLGLWDASYVNPTVPHQLEAHRISSGVRHTAGKKKKDLQQGRKPPAARHRDLKNGNSCVFNDRTRPILEKTGAADIHCCRCSEPDSPIAAANLAMLTC